MAYGYGFMMGSIDANGDGIHDGTGISFGHGFGWLDADGDGVNDAFVDVDGDGLNDLSGYGYRMGYVHAGGDAGMHDQVPIDWPMEPQPGMGGQMGAGHM
jgi:hypothetical protein